MAAQPNLERGVALTDVDRDGDTELAVTTGRQAGSFALEREERRWAGFRPFAAWPKVEGTVGRTFTIDLNGDGRQDTAHFLAPGSGFLVFDRNGDGKITQASELFGPQTGDGFGELSSLDEDGSGWIDAGDSSYDQLQVWTRDAAGKDQLQSLQAAGVGAVSVARLATPFELKDAGNATLGAVRSTGVYLAESGQAGTVQQIDLVV